MEERDCNCYYACVCNLDGFHIKIEAGILRLTLRLKFVLISGLICKDSGFIYEGLKTGSRDRDVMIVISRKKYLAHNHVLTIKCQNIHFSCEEFVC
jgi:hypothetical protein